MLKFDLGNFSYKCDAESFARFMLQAAALAGTVVFGQGLIFGARCDRQFDPTWGNIHIEAPRVVGCTIRRVAGYVPSPDGEPIPAGRDIVSPRRR